MRRHGRATLVVAALAFSIGGTLLRVTPLPAPVVESRALERPTLLLLTSLPLLFGENFAMPGPAAPAIQRLSQRYTVRPIAIADAASLTDHRILLMAQPRAQTAQALVDLDAWVRHGGRLMLLADPMLDWPSKRPLGDRLRPPHGFADTGLLVHWGIALQRPDRRGPVVGRLDGRTLRFASPGTLSGKGCSIVADNHVARCRIDRGRVTIVADADVLDPELSGGSAAENLRMLLDELARLQH